MEESGHKLVQGRGATIVDWSRKTTLSGWNLGGDGRGEKKTF